MDAKNPLPSELLRQATVKALCARVDLPETFKNGSSANLGKIHSDLSRVYHELDAIREKLKELGL